MNPGTKEKSAVHPKYEKIYTSDPLAEAPPDVREKVNLLVDYIMKNCLWQFNSRGWDRRKQNAGVIGKTAQILCGETVENTTSIDKCYWVDAVCLAEAYRQRHPWLAAMDAPAIRSLMEKLHQRMDWLTIDGSLNEELTVQQY
jgi:nitrogenase delta subunit